MKMMKSMKILKTLIVIVLLVSMGLSGCTPGGSTVVPNKKITVALDWLPNTNHTGLFVAKELGYFDIVGLNVEIVEAPNYDALPMLASGQAQFGVSCQENIATALENKNPLPVKAVAALLQHNTSGIISLKKNNILSPKDLEGKRYQEMEMQVEKPMILSIMKSDGGDFSKVKFIPNLTTDPLTALQTDVDATWVFYGWDVIAAQVKKVDVNFFTFKDINPLFDYYTPLLASSNDFLAKEPEVARKFLTALAKGYEYAIAHPVEAAKILVKNAPGTDSIIAEKSQIYLAGQYKAEVKTWGQIDETRWTNFYKWLFENKVITKDLGNQGYTNDFLAK